MSEGNTANGVVDFMEFIKRKGLNTTSQRKAIAEIFFSLSGHYSLEEFYKIVSKQDPGIGQTTVYRTLKLLCDAGFVTENHFSDDITRYEKAKSSTHHDHLVCLLCGKIIEFCEQEIEQKQIDIAAKYGFTLTRHVHNMYGFCAECQANQPIVNK